MSPPSNVINPRHHHAISPRVRHCAIRYAGLGLSVLLIVAAFAWWQQTRAALQEASGRTERVTVWCGKCQEIARDFVVMYSAVLQPPGADREEFLHELVRSQQDAESRLAVLRDELGRAQDVPGHEDLVRLFNEVDMPMARFSTDLLRVIELGPSGPPARETMRVKLNAARNGFDELNSVFSQFSDSLNNVRATLLERRENAKHKHEQSTLLLIAVLGTLLAGASFLVHRFRQRALSEVTLKRAAEANYRSIFDNALEGMFQTTPDGRYLRANNALAKMYGYRSPEHLIESMSDIGTQLYAEPKERQALLRKLQQKDVLTNLEIEIVRADGRTMWIRENVRAVRDKQGALLYLEGTVQDISDRYWSEQRRCLQYETARILEQTTSVAEARPLILQAICEILHWDMGAVWNVNADSALLECVEVWHAPGIDIAEFEETVAQTKYRMGEGLAGEVWESGETKWIADLSARAQTPSARIAAKHGMGSAFGVPLKVGGAVRHVAEFFSPKISLSDPELLQTLGLIANLLGQLIERKGAEEELRKSELRKAAILQSALDCILSFDLDGRIVEFNPAAEKTFGIPRAEALNRNIVELLAPAEIHKTHRRGIAMFNAANTPAGSGQRVELMAVYRTGRKFPVEVAISRTSIDDVPMFTAFLRDVSERKRAAALTSELAAVVANSNDAIIGCTSEGVIRSWNTGAERIYGWSAREAMGRSLEMLIPPERRDEYPRTLAAVREGECLANYETVRLRKDGKKICVSITESPIRRDDGRVTGLSSIARDITERKRLEEELLQSQKMEAVGRLAGGIAHDFNNILTAILGYSDLLMGRIEAQHWMFRYLSEIRKAADFAAVLTHQLLAFSRRQPLYPRVFSINDTVRNLQKMLERVIGERIKIRTELNAEIGHLKADAGQLEQVLLNLCVNARDAMPQGGTITVSTADVTYFPNDDEPSLSDMPAGEYVQLTVADTGTGMPPEVMKHIFEPFFTTKEKGQGTGLGLATCYGIVKQSGGYITVNSQPGEGTTFRVYLPRAEESGEKAPSRKEIGQMRGGSETVLYVEDETAVRSLSAHVLRQLGYTVLEASDAKEAKAVLERQDKTAINLLFCDVVLPDAAGRELADWLQARQPAVRVLYTSGYVDEKVLRGHGIDSSCAFLQKPFTPADLARQVREVIESGRPGTVSTEAAERQVPFKAPLPSGVN